MRFEDVILYLDRVGVADVILPFILVFTVVFAVLKKSKLLGEDGDRFNIVLALVMGLAVIFPHVTNYGPDIVPIINNALPNVAVVAIALIMFMFLLGLWGTDWEIAGKSFGTWVVVLSIGVILYIFGAAAGWGWDVPDFLYFLRDTETQALLITLLVFGLIIGYITKDPKTHEGEKGFQKIMDTFNIFKGKKGP